MGGLSLQIDIQLPVAEEIPAPAGYGMGGQRLVLRAQGDMYRDKVHHVVQVPLIHDGLGAIARLLGRLEEELDLSLQLPLPFHQLCGDAQADSRVSVMAAGVY